MLRFGFLLLTVVILPLVFASVIERDENLEDEQNVLRKLEDLLEVRCIALGGTGCEGNNGKCCRDGDPYTGTMRQCTNTGSFMGPVWRCME